MSESVVDAADVEETVTRVLTHFVQGGDEQAEMSVELLQKTGGVACGMNPTVVLYVKRVIPHCFAKTEWGH